MDSDSNWYSQEPLLVQAIRQSGWSVPPEPVVPGYAEWQELRRGGQGVVYRATQLSTRRQVAVKILSGGPVASREQLHRFDREVEVIAGFQHPHIVRLYDRGLTEQGFPYYVMEFIDGCGLDEYLLKRRHPSAPTRSGWCERPQNTRDQEAADGARSSPSDSGEGLPPTRWAAMQRVSDKSVADWTANEALLLFVKVCQAIAYAHARGVVHRDIKPNNILIDSDGEPHVLDFGLAKSVLSAGQTSSAAVSRTGDFMGTLPWASPEQVEGVPARIEARSDVYSLGVVLFQMLTGQMPYAIGSLPQAIESIRHVEPPRPSTLRRGLSAELDAITLRCLAKAPEGRYSDAGELVEDLNRYLRGQPVAAKVASRMRRAWKQVRRYQTRIGLAGGLVALTVATAFAFRGSAPQGVAPAVGPAKARTVFDLADRIAELDGATTLFVHELPEQESDISIPGNLVLGYAGAAGRHKVAGGQRLQATQRIFVGFDGSGSLEVADGGQVADTDGVIGHEVQGRGAVTLTGAGSRWESTHALYVGYRGSGTLDVTGGAHAEAGESTLGAHPRAEGRVNVIGAGSTWTTRLSAAIGGPGIGEVRIADGGAASASSSSLAVAPGSRAGVTVIGDHSAWHNRSSIYVGGVTGRGGGEARLVIEDGATVVAAQLLRVFGGGTVSLSGGMLSTDLCEHTLGGTFDFSGGRLHVNRFVGDLVNPGGTLGLAHSPGILQVTGNYHQSDGVLELRIHDPAFGESDQLVVAGTATLAGRLAVLRSDGFVPAYDNRFTILSAAAINGRFQDGEAQVELVGGGRCDITYADTEVTLTHFEGPFPPDMTAFNPWPGGPLPRPVLPDGPCPRRLSRNTTGEHDLVFLGPPDAIAVGLAGQMVEFDFGNQRVVDGPGADFNLYELAVGGAEFASIDVLVSEDGTAFVSVQDTGASVVRIPGDESWPDLKFSVSYDLAGSGLKQVRYIRVDGDGDAPLSGSLGFDLDAIAAIHLAPTGEE